MKYKLFKFKSAIGLVLVTEFNSLENVNLKLEKGDYIIMKMKDGKFWKYTSFRLIDDSYIESFEEGV